MGQCPGCKAWNTLEAFTVKAASPAQRAVQSAGKGLQPVQARPLADVKVMEMDRMSTGDPELDRVLGKGVVPGAVVLLGGEPGIGKSTFDASIGIGHGQEIRSYSVCCW